MILYDNAVEIVVSSIKEVTEDDGFLLPTAEAKEALSIATMTLEWISKSQDKQLLNNFCFSLCESFSTQIISTRVNNKVDSRSLWAYYHKVITCSQFKSSWTSFLNRSVGVEYSPMFCQYVTRAVHDKLVVMFLPASESEPSAGIMKDLTSTELNALNYAAGYVIKKVKQSQSQSKQLLDAVEEFTCHQDEEEEEESEKWIDSIDRGGLTHINRKTFHFFHTMEKELRVYFNMSKMGDTPKEAIVNVMKEDIDVKYSWDEIFEDVSKESRDILLDEIVRLYVTMRGFSYTKSWLEMYKKRSKTSIQKSKGLRKKVSSDS